jgi:Tfp pilus assembly protein PilO
MPQIEPRLTGLKKRQQIEHANRTMFIWVAIASVAISICIVASQFFIQKLIYNQRVINAKMKASDTLSKNIQNAKTLKEEVDALVGNQDLSAVKTNPEDANTRSVLDALPSKADPTALATSLQQVILSRSAVVIESITVPSDDTTTDQNGETAAPADSSAPVEQPFSVTVTGSYDKIRAMIIDLERTIRPMKVTAINLNGTDASMRVTVEGVTYYQPAKGTSLKSEVIK